MVSDIDFLHELRLAELETVLRCFPPSARVLEIGSGTGRQALEIQSRGFDVSAIDIPESNYKRDRVFPITDYDGHQLPFQNESFDVVFTSNVLAHVDDVQQLHREIRRVLRDGGVAIHIVPTATWRLVTLLGSPVAAIANAAELRPKLVPRGLARATIALAGRAWLRALWRLLQPLRLRPLGKRGNAISELWLYTGFRWARYFRENGFCCETRVPGGLLYSGNLIFRHRLGFPLRRKLARWLGSSCWVFVVSPLDGRSDATASSHLP